MQREYVIAILKQTWAPFTAQLGTQNVAYVVDHAETASPDELFEDVKEGANIDLDTAIKITLAAAQLISLGVQLYLRLHPKPDSKELANQMQSKVDPKAPQEVRSPEKIERVAEAIVNNPPVP